MRDRKEFKNYVWNTHLSFNFAIYAHRTLQNDVIYAYYTTR